MKHLLTTCIFLFLTNFLVDAQDCEPYIPMDEGVEFEMKSYNAKDKFQSKTIQKVTSKTASAGNVEATLHMDIYDKKDELTTSTEYTISCKDGVFMVDMQMFIPQESMTAYQNMEMTVDGDFLEFPANPIAGQQLKDGHLSISIGSEGITMMKMNIDITNRRVEVIEDVTTPAGTFKCARFSYDVAIAMPIRIRAKASEWYCIGGLVRSESYDKNGKLRSYSVLTSYKK